MELDSVHQQHVQSNLNGKKRKAAEKLMQALQAITHKVNDTLSHSFSLRAISTSIDQ